jgi:hypothetical protein
MIDKPALLHGPKSEQRATFARLNDWLPDLRRGSRPTPALGGGTLSQFPFVFSQTLTQGANGDSSVRSLGQRRLGRSRYPKHKIL